MQGLCLINLFFVWPHSVILGSSPDLPPRLRASSEIVPIPVLGLLSASFFLYPFLFYCAFVRFVFQVWFIPEIFMRRADESKVMVALEEPFVLLFPLAFCPLSVFLSLTSFFPPPPKTPFLFQENAHNVFLPLPSCSDDRFLRLEDHSPIGLPSFKSGHFEPPLLSRTFDFPQFIDPHSAPRDERELS